MTSHLEFPLPKIFLSIFFVFFFQVGAKSILDAEPQFDLKTVLFPPLHNNSLKKTHWATAAYSNSNPELRAPTSNRKTALIEIAKGFFFFFCKIRSEFLKLARRSPP